MDTISLKRDIPIEQNKSVFTEPATRESNLRLLTEIDERRGSSREEGADATKKPLIDYDEWGDIDRGLYREESVRDMLVEGGVCDERVPRWEYWNKKDTMGKWGSCES